MAEQLEIKAITKKILRESLDTNAYWKDEVAPIPKSKAQWLLTNDRIDEEDYCGLIGYENQKMIGFIYLLPDLVNMVNAAPQKAYWMILWWVDTKYKDTVFSTYLFNEAINHAGKKVLIKSYAEHVNEFYEKQPFDVIISRLRYTIFFSLDTSILLGRFSFLKPFSFFIEQADRLSGKLIRSLNKVKTKNRITGLRYEYINQLDEEAWQFIKPLCKDDLIYKSKEYVNWQLSSIQYTQMPVDGKATYASLQVGAGKNMGISTFNVFKGERQIGLISYVLNHKECNIKYFLVADEQDYMLCVDALLDNVIASKANFIFTDDEKLAAHITKRYTTVYTYKVTKKGLVHKEAKMDTKPLHLQNHDGHFY